MRATMSLYCFGASYRQPLSARNQNACLSWCIIAESFCGSAGMKLRSGGKDLEPYIAELPPSLKWLDLSEHGSQSVAYTTTGGVCITGQKRGCALATRN